MRIMVAVALADRQEVVELEMAEGSDVQAALATAHIAKRYPELDMAHCEVGVWSKPCARSTKLRDGDRVEIYRPLKADAKEMRRSRAQVKPSNRSRSGP